MSDSAEGPGWWVASDGKWYPPESHPDRRSSRGARAASLPPSAPPRPTTLQPPPGFPTGSTAGPFGPPRRPWWRRWWVVGLALVIVGAVVAAAIGSQDDSADDASDLPVATDDIDPAATGRSEPASPDTANGRGTREQPFAIGEAVSFVVDSLGEGDGSVWTLTVDEAGSDITAAVLAENSFNDAPEAGSVYFGVPVTLRLDAAGKEPLSTLFNIELELFGSSTLAIIDAGLDETCGVVPDGFDPFKEVFVGGAISGVVCLEVTEPDVDAGVLLTLDSNEGDRLFVATRADQADPPAGGRVGATTIPTDSGSVGDSPGSRGAPYAVGEEIDFRVDSLGEGDGSEWTLTVDGPGGDLTDAVLAENQFNDAPADGALYYAVPVTLTLRAADKEPLSALFNIELEFYGPVTLEIIDLGLDEGCGVVPDGFDPTTEVFVGGSVSGNLCLEVTEPDVEAGVLLTLDSNEGDRIFVATR